MNWEKELEESIYNNFVIFLNSSLEYFNRGMNEYANALLATVNIQLALELLFKGIVMEKESVKSVLNVKQQSLDMKDIEKLYNDNKLRYRDYADIKNHIKRNVNIYGIESDEFEIIDKFLDYRNKILHGSYSFSQEELSKNNTWVIHILVYIMCHLLAYDYEITKGFRHVISNINRGISRTFI